MNKKTLLVVTPSFFPYRKGGTEKYVYDFIKNVDANLWRVFVLTPLDKTDHYVFEGISVYTFDVYVGLSDFCNRIEQLNPDIVHFHSIDGELNVLHIKACVQKQYKIYLTFHLYNSICLNGGTLRQNTSESCNGKVGIAKCLYCKVGGSFKIRIISLLVRIGAGKFIPQYYNSFGERYNMLRFIKKHVQIIAFNRIQQSILSANGLKSILIPHAVDSNMKPELVTLDRNDDVLTIGFVGRISDEKGLHVLIDVFKRLGRDSMKLLILGLVNDVNDVYVQQIINQVRGDERITIELNISIDNIQNIYDRMDLLCVPSLVKETGPMVVLEAFARKVPVLVSEYASSYVSNSEDGFVYQDDTELGKVLNYVANNKAVLTDMKRHIKAPLTFKDMVDQHLAYYAETIN